MRGEIHPKVSRVKMLADSSGHTLSLSSAINSCIIMFFVNCNLKSNNDLPDKDAWQLSDLIILLVQNSIYKEA